ncbi:hypothetical protein ACFX13_008125 [Malus domestica]
MGSPPQNPNWVFDYSVIEDILVPGGELPSLDPPLQPVHLARFESGRQRRQQHEQLSTTTTATPAARRMLCRFESPPLKALPIRRRQLSPSTTTVQRRLLILLVRELRFTEGSPDLLQTDKKQTRNVY